MSGFPNTVSDMKQLKDKSLFIEKCYVNGEWKAARSGEVFEVQGHIP
jgi:succinate-semialdehyde dehydrogenase/glutarate-semialdehyde dehydrogenase